MPFIMLATYALFIYFLVAGIAILCIGIKEKIKKYSEKIERENTNRENILKALSKYNEPVSLYKIHDEKSDDWDVYLIEVENCLNKLIEEDLVVKNNKENYYDTQYILKSKLKNKYKKCKKCKKESNDNEYFCSKCGSLLYEIEKE